MMKSTIFWPALLLMSLVGSSACGRRIEFQARYWQPRFQEEIRFSGDGIRGSVLDINDDLNIDSEGDDVLPVGMVLQFRDRYRLWLDFQMTEIDARASVQDTFVFAGAGFPSGADIVSRLELSLGELGVELDCVEEETFALGPCVRTMFFHQKLTITDSGSRTRGRGTLIALVPGFGLSARLRLLNDKLELRGRFMGAAYDDRSHTDLVLEVEYEVFANVGVLAGYRNLDVNVDESEYFAEGGISGFFIGAAVSF